MAKNLTEHFTLEELTASAKAVELGLDNTPTEIARRNLYFLAEQLERIRTILGNKPLVISSGYRSPEVNRALRGAPTSMHCYGLAADFTCPAFGSPQEICLALLPYAQKLNWDQLIWEQTWVHYGLVVPRGEVLTAHFVDGKPQYVQGILS